MNKNYLNPKVHAACAWMGPANVLIFVIGFVAFADFLPPWSAADTAEQVAGYYTSNLTGIRIGCIIMLLGSTLTIPWSMAVVATTRKIETELPIFTYMQICCAGCAVALAVLLPTVWGLAAFRPDDISPEITRMLHDAGWFLYLFTWPPFAVWCVAIAIPVLKDKRPEPILPRWVGYMNLWVAALEAPAGLMLFFKSGPFSYNGVIAFYLPSVVYFLWIVLMIIAVMRSIKREQSQPTTSSVDWPERGNLSPSDS